MYVLGGIIAGENDKIKHRAAETGETRLFQCYAEEHLPQRFIGSRFESEKCLQRVDSFDLTRVFGLHVLPNHVGLLTLERPLDLGIFEGILGVFQL